MKNARIPIPGVPSLGSLCPSVTPHLSFWLWSLVWLSFPACLFFLCFLKKRLPLPNQRLSLTRSPDWSSQWVPSSSSCVFSEMVTFMWTPHPIFYLKCGFFPDLQSLAPACPLCPILTPPCIFGFSLFWFSLSAYKCVQSSGILKLSYPVCLSFETQVSWKSQQHAVVFTSSHLIY